MIVIEMMLIADGEVGGIPLPQSAVADGEYRFAPRAKYRCGNAAISLADRPISLSVRAIATISPIIGKRTTKSHIGKNDIQPLRAERYCAHARNDITASAVTIFAPFRREPIFP